MDRVVIIGGGPGGATLGCYLSKLGIPHVILEKANHPRPHVGESLVPSTTRIFRDIGFLEEMERRRFPKKYGASWNAGSFGTFAIEFAEFDQAGVEQDYTYHVDRGEFDLALLKHAEKLGSKVLQGVAVKEVTFGANGFTSGVVCEVAGESCHIPSSLVVDASGRSTVLGQQLHIKDKDPHFNQFAVHAWYENVDRGSGPSKEHIRIYFLPVERGWVWQIPITATTTSVGVVVDRKVFKGATDDLEGYFRHHIASSRDLAKAMAGASRINEFKIEGDYSYRMRNFVGDGFLLIGDAARFVDPIFSSGVSVALTSAKFASEVVAKAWESGRRDRECFMGYEQKLRRGTDIWYEFITRYYRLLPLFTYFINHPKHRHGVLQLLQGEVYDRQSVPVLQEMDDFIRSVESTEGHFLQAQLRNIEAHGPDPR